MPSTRKSRQKGKKRRQKRNKNAKSLQNLVLVQSTLGNSIVPSDFMASLHIAEGAPRAEKRAADLQKGEMAWWHKQGIDLKESGITVDTIDSILIEGSPRYLSAKQALHAERDKTLITKFRHDLIRGVAQHAGVSKENLEQKLFREGDQDFTQDEYARMNNYVGDFLEQHMDRPRYGRSTVRGWLKGEVLAPDDWEVFEVLAEQVPEFASYSNPKSEGGLKDHYKIYKVLRSGTLAYLSNQGAGKRKNKERKLMAGESIALAQELDLVLSEFAEEIDDVYLAALILNVRPLRPGEGTSTSQKSRLRKGLMVADESQSSDDTLSPRELVEHSNIFQFGLSYLLELYVRKNPECAYSNYIKTAGPKLQKFKQSDPLLQVSTIVGVMGRRNNEYAKWLQHDRLKAAFGVSPDEMAGLIYEDLVDGTVDRVLEIEGSFQIFQTYKRISQVVPFIVDEYDCTRKDQGVADKVRELAKLSRKMERLGIGGKNQIFLSHMIKNQYAQGDPPLIASIQDPEKMLEVARSVKSQRIPLYTRQQVADALKKYGANKLLNFFPETEFLHESLN